MRTWASPLLFCAVSPVHKAAFSIEAGTQKSRWMRRAKGEHCEGGWIYERLHLSVNTGPQQSINTFLSVSHTCSKGLQESGFQQAEVNILVGSANAVPVRSSEPQTLKLTVFPRVQAHLKELSEGLVPWRAAALLLCSEFTISNNANAHIGQHFHLVSC